MKQHEIQQFINSDENLVIEELMHLSSLHEQAAKKWIITANNRPQLPFLMFGPVWNKPEVKKYRDQPIADLKRSEFHYSQAVKCMDLIDKLNDPNSRSKEEWQERADRFKNAIKYLPIAGYSIQRLEEKNKLWQKEITRCQSIAAGKECSNENIGPKF